MVLLAASARHAKRIWNCSWRFFLLFLFIVGGSTTVAAAAAVVCTTSSSSSSSSSSLSSSSETRDTFVWCSIGRIECRCSSQLRSTLATIEECCSVWCASSTRVWKPSRDTVVADASNSSRRACSLLSCVSRLVCLVVFFLGPPSSVGGVTVFSLTPSRSRLLDITASSVSLTTVLAGITAPPAPTTATATGATFDTFWSTTTRSSGMVLLWEVVLWDTIWVACRPCCIVSASSATSAIVSLCASYSVA